jgi:hypothetical protein
MGHSVERIAPFSDGASVNLWVSARRAVWLTDGGVTLTDIGLFAVVGLPCTWIFLWAPLMARYRPPL